MKIINENPDFFTLPDGTEIDYEDKNTYAFGYWKNKLYISDEGGTHYKMKEKYQLDMPTGGDVRNKFEYPGRIWLDYNAISFWKYPESSYKLRKICEDLSKLIKNKIGKK